jgi:hypothetical protein
MALPADLAKDGADWSPVGPDSPQPSAHVAPHGVVAGKAGGRRLPDTQAATGGTESGM